MNRGTGSEEMEVRRIRRRRLGVRAGASLLLLAATVVASPGQAEAQEAEVRAAVEATLQAFTDGDSEAIGSFFHPQVRGFFLDGGILIEGFEVTPLRMAFEAGLRANLNLRDLKVAVYDDVAASSAFLDGELVLPGGGSIAGTWRYTETRVPVDGQWTVVQFHFSEFTMGR